MQRTLRLMGALIVTAAILIAPAGANAALCRCYISNNDYFDDSSCTNQVGGKAWGCCGGAIWSWGDVTSHYIYYVDGGYGICGCGGEDYSTWGTVGCDSDVP